MLRAVLRWSGYVALAAAMVLGMFDGARSISISGLSLTSLGDAAQWLLPRQFALLEQAVAFIHPFLWNPVLQGLMQLPGAAVLFLMGGLLLLLGRRPAPPPLGGADSSGLQRMRSPG
jgi:hypothetical protein